MENNLSGFIYAVVAVLLAFLIANILTLIIKKICKIDQEYYCENCGHSENVDCEEQAGRTVERARACSHGVED